MEDQAPDCVGYEKAKAELPPMSPEDYQREIMRLAEEYGV